MMESCYLNLNGWLSNERRGEWSLLLPHAFIVRNGSYSRWFNVHKSSRAFAVEGEMPKLQLWGSHGNVVLRFFACYLERKQNVRFAYLLIGPALPE